MEVVSRPQSKKIKEPRVKNMIFTMWDIKGFDTWLAQMKGISYACRSGIEICPKTQKEHIHCTIVWRSGGRNFTKINKALGIKGQTKDNPVGWVERCRDLMDCIKYCKKEESRKPGEMWTEINPENRPIGQGHRTDWDEKKDLCKKRKLDILQEDPELVIKYSHGCDVARSLWDKKRSKFRHVHVIDLNLNTIILMTILEYAFEPEEVYLCKGILEEFDEYDDEKILVLPYSSKHLQSQLSSPLRVPMKLRYRSTLPKWEVIFI